MPSLRSNFHNKGLGCFTHPFFRVIINRINNSENHMRISRITPQEEGALKKCIAPYVYTIQKQNAKTATVVIRAPKNDRNSVKLEIEKKLTDKKYSFMQDRSGGSTGSTIISYKNTRVQIIYKPLSGGMSETTLNSTITELAPALAFMANKKFTDVNKFHKFLMETIPTANKYGCYLNAQDKNAGHKFIQDMPSSSKFEEKMDNAIGILDYLYDLDSKSKIDQVYFAYRAKPQGINVNHKGDLFVQFKNKKWLGVSLKAGGEKTAEPQLNTYVNKLFDDYNRPSDKTQLMNKVYNEVHSKLGLGRNWADRTNKKQSIEAILKYKENNPKTYEESYDKMLEICRTAVVDAVNKNLNDTKNYIVKQVLKKDDNVPLVVVKAVGRSYKMVTDEDKLENFLPRADKITARKSTGSKQEWFIDLTNKKEKLTMKMSIRTNQPEPNNKIAQGFNLAIKFNGLT